MNINLEMLLNGTFRHCNGECRWKCVGYSLDNNSDPIIIGLTMSGEHLCKFVLSSTRDWILEKPDCEKI
jgi:hypothetical protein